jgi:ribosomal protein S18 acetylase RimI-like enzyme
MAGVGGAPFAAAVAVRPIHHDRHQRCGSKNSVMPCDLGNLSEAGSSNGPENEARSPEDQFSRPSSGRDNIGGQVDPHGRRLRLVSVHLPADAVVRSPTTADVPIILDVIHAYDIETIGYPDYTADDVRDDLADPRLDPERDAWLVLDAAGTAIGWAWIIDRNRTGALEADAYVRPGAPQVIGAFLVDRIVERAGEIAVRNGVAEAEVGVGIVTNDTRTAGWLAWAGFSVARLFSRMEVALTGAERPPQLPPGTRIRAVVGDDDRRTLHWVLTEAFAEHFGSVAEAYDDWSARMTAASTADPSQWWLAEVDGVAAGCAIGTEQFAAENGGWVKYLAVLAPYRGRGLGRALLQHVLAEFARRGRVKAGLGVDTQNETGALRLYESIGMRPAYQADIWKLQVFATRSGAPWAAGSG